MPIFEFNEKQWYQGMWRAEIKGGDFLAFMWLEDSSWHFRYRLRYYADNKTWGSDDRKTAHGFTGKDEPGAKEKMFAAVQELLNVMVTIGELRQLEYFPCCGTEVEMMNILEKIQDGIHIKKLTEEEAAREGYVLPKKSVKKKK